MKKGLGVINFLLGFVILFLFSMDANSATIQYFHEDFSSEPDSTIWYVIYDGHEENIGERAAFGVSYGDVGNLMHIQGGYHAVNHYADGVGFRNNPTLNVTGIESVVLIPEGTDTVLGINLSGQQVDNNIYSSIRVVLDPFQNTIWADIDGRPTRVGTFEFNKWYKLGIKLSKVEIGSKVEISVDDRTVYDEYFTGEWVGSQAEIWGTSMDWIPEGYSQYVTVEASTIGEKKVSVDVKPRSCPNTLNVKSKGVLPVAILGTNEFNVNDIDVATIKLAGVEPLRSSLEDVSSPSTPGNCSDVGLDGIPDLTLKFSIQEIVAALGDVEDGEEIPLTLTGKLSKDLQIEGEDTILIVKKDSKGKYK